MINPTTSVTVRTIQFSNGERIPESEFCQGLNAQGVLRMHPAAYSEVIEHFDTHRQLSHYNMSPVSHGDAENLVILKILKPGRCEQGQEIPPVIDRFNYCVVKLDHVEEGVAFASLTDDDQHFEDSLDCTKGRLRLGEELVKRYQSTRGLTQAGLEQCQVAITSLRLNMGALPANRALSSSASGNV